jgi:hypothetical protein
VPSWRTDDPVAPVATVDPIAVRSYFTVALVAESSVTESTLEDTAAASGLDANAAIEAENCEPFWSSCIRLLFGVEELKKVVQLVVISVTAADEPPDDAADDAGVAADDAGAAADDAGAVDEEEELELLEQADMAAMSTRPSVGAK